MQNNSYEIGVKSMWLDNRVRLNAAVFYQDLTDMQAQVNVIDNGNWITQVQNAAEATIKGFELEALLKVIDGLDISVGYGYVDAEYDKFMSPDPAAGGFACSRRIERPWLRVHAQAQLQPVAELHVPAFSAEW